MYIPSVSEAEFSQLDLKDVAHTNVKKIFPTLKIVVGVDKVELLPLSHGTIFVEFNIRGGTLLILCELNPTGRGPILMSQSVGGPTVMASAEVGARHADPNVPFQPDGIQVMPIWSAQTRLVTEPQLINSVLPRTGVTTISNPLHSIPPPPQYPPPPLPAVNQSRLQPILTKPYYPHSPGTGHSSSTNLEYDVRFVHSADGFHPENTRFINIYTPGAIYVRAPSDVPLATSAVAGPQRMHNGLPPAHSTHAPQSTTTVSQLCLQQPDMSVMGLARPDRAYLRASSRQRVGRSVPPGTRVGDGSSSELSTVSGLGSVGRENESGKFIRLPDSVVSNSRSGSSDSSGSGLRSSGAVTHLGSHITPQSFHTVATTSVAASAGFLSDPSISFRVRHERAPNTDIKSTLFDDSPTGMSNGHPSHVCHINDLRHT
ncbi:hypothetical protein AHF37_03126 [Paragonimus kellicotti]|nr:hypothetical protein AHF37_03126 [Paragonimus kellicotti]